ncbi:MAG TPA: hypothetical protein VFH92_02020, partial [Phenylobacterium sp.]|nr:hypothetical protein [Phenylobacterium sp.]
MSSKLAGKGASVVDPPIHRCAGPPVEPRLSPQTRVGHIAAVSSGADEAMMRFLAGMILALAMAVPAWAQPVNAGHLTAE